MKPLLVAVCFFVMLSKCTKAQVLDTATARAGTADSTKAAQVPTDIYKHLLDSNLFVQAKGRPEALPITIKKHRNQQIIFYSILLLFLLLGIAKTFYARYFNTVFKVFFNTSLRQNQLTDQLEQAKLPSLIFNVFFIITAGFYCYFLIQQFSDLAVTYNNYLLFACIAAVGICYTVKYFSLLFIGWLTNSKAEANTYIFIIFLLNKVMGVFFLAVIPLLAFGSNVVASYALLFSLIGISLVFLIRFFRAYSLLQARLKVSRFHFFIYVIALEILPLAIIYKFVMLYFNTKS